MNNFLERKTPKLTSKITFSNENLKKNILQIKTLVTLRMNEADGK